MSVRIPEKLLRRLDAIAEYHGHSRSYLLLLAQSAIWFPNGRAHRMANDLRSAYDRARRRR